MPRYFLSQVSIEGFRGINNEGDPIVLKFKPNAVNSIYAHNGTGKTSIFEAIHYAIFGIVPRLSRLQESEDPDAYVINRFHAGQKATIGLLFAPDDGSQPVEITVQRDVAGTRTVSSSSGHPSPEDFLSELRQDFVLVDYRKFSDFVDSSALERGRSFASLVGLSDYSRIRQVLEGASDTRALNTDFDLKGLQARLTAREREASTAAAQALAAYNEICAQSIDTLGDHDTLCTSVAATLETIELLKPLVSGKDIRRIDLDAAEQAVTDAEGGPLRAEHSAILRNVAHLVGLVAAVDEEQERAELLRLASERDTAMANAGSSALRDLYERAKGVLIDPSWPDPHQCPVCDTQLTSNLQAHLTARILQYRAADEANEALREAIEVSAALSRLGSLEGDAEFSIPTADRLHNTTIRAAKDRMLATPDLQKALGRIDEIEQMRLDAIRRLESRKTAIEAVLPPSLVAVSKTLVLARQFREALATHKQVSDEVTKDRRALKVRERWKTFITEASKAFSAAEAKLANERISTIEADYQGLFVDLVRGGPDVKPTLERARGSENVALKLANFHGLSGINARAVLSESYRNAVAGSVFLSAALRYTGTPRFMVLDDVTSSFDAGHQFSLMEAIRTKLQQPTNANGLQFILLSHDGALEKYFDKQNGTPNWHHQKLMGMPPTGRVMISAQEADRLKVQAQHFLNLGQVDYGAPFVRQYLEYKLGFVISKLEIPVPPDYLTRSSNRTVSTYLKAICEMIDLFQAAGRCVLSAQQIADINNTHAPAVIANFVSHYETGTGAPLGAYALLGVLQTIDDLADCFTWLDATKSPPEKRYYRGLGQR